MKKMLRDATRSVVYIVVAICLFSACSSPEQLQIEIKEKRDLHDQKVAAVKQKLECIEKGNCSDPDEDSGGGGFGFWSCICTYRRGSTPPSSCSDSRCSTAKYSKHNR
jgi:hypothetical protein